MAEPFSNEPIPVDHLPQLRDDAFVPVDPRYLRASLAGFSVTATLLVGGGVFWLSQADSATAPVLVIGGMLVVLAAAALLRIVEVRRLGYQVREHDLSLRRGVITQRVESLPFARTQHVSIHRGPVERALGLATLTVSSAGPDITVPGLAADDAARIKALVTERAGVADDDADGGGADESVALPPPSLLDPPPA